MSMLLDIFSGLCLLAGSFFCITTGVGLLRLPDFFTRTHAVGVIDGLGAGLILFGLALQAPDYMVLLKLGFTYLFMLITGPAAVHALARAALISGLEPMLARPDEGEELGDES